MLKVFEATVEQEDIFNVKLEENLILLIQALAGTGKTTTLMEIIKNNISKQFLYLSFNNKIVEEVTSQTKRKKIQNLVPKTFHGLAHMYVTPELVKKGQTLQKKFDAKFLERVYGETMKPFERYSLIKWFNNFTNQALELEDYKKKIMNLTKEERFQLQVHENSGYLKVIFKLIDRFYNDMANYDKDTGEGIPFFTFGFYLKYFIDNIENYDIKMDVILIDEAQDLNPIMLKAVMSFISKGKTLITVGDSNQSIYAFINNIDLLNQIFHIIDEDKTKIVVKKLTNSFRFASGTKMESLSNLILGFRAKNEQDLIKGVAKHEDDIIRDVLYLGRSNSQVLWNAYKSALNKERFHLVGGIATDTKNLMLDIEHLSEKRHNNIKSKLLKDFESIADLKDFALVQGDKEISSIITLVKHMSNEKNAKNEKLKLFEFFRTIEKGGTNEISMKMDENPVYYSTIHKAKGLEYDEVQLLPRMNENSSMLIGFNKDFFRKSEDEHQVVVKLNPAPQVVEELNLLYVAFTRAKKSLSILNDEVNMNLKFLSSLDKFEKRVDISNYEMDAKNSAYNYPNNTFIKVRLNDEVFLVNSKEFEDFKKIIALQEVY